MPNVYIIYASGGGAVQYVYLCLRRSGVEVYSYSRLVYVSELCHTLFAAVNDFLLQTGRLCC